MNIVFMGTPDFAVASLEALVASGVNVQLVVTQPDRGRGRGQKLTLSPVKRAAVNLGLPVAQPESARDETFIKKINSLSPDIIVVVAFGQILPAGLLSIPPLGCVNVHGSILPRYRGAAPIQRAVMNGDVFTGITTMLINERMDEGDILETRKTQIGKNETAGALFDRLKKIGVETLLNTLDSLSHRTITPLPQNSEGATYAPKIRKEERVICWSQSSREIFNIFRGLTPSPGVFSMLNGKRVIISECKLAESPVVADAVPGDVVCVERGAITVLTGNREALLLTRVRPEGKRDMSVSEFLTGHSLKVGDRFC